MNPRAGAYAGCAWLGMAALFAVGAYWGLGLAGPSGLPGAVAFLALSALSVLLAAALWTGIGGRRVAATSALLGLVVATISLADPWASDSSITSGNVGGAIVGIGIALASAFAFRYRYPTSADAGTGRRP